MNATMQTNCRHCTPSGCASPFLTNAEVGAILRAIMPRDDFFPLQSALMEVKRQMEMGNSQRAYLRDFLLQYSQDADPMFRGSYVEMADLVMQCSFGA